MRMIDREETLKAMDTWDKFGYLAHVGLIRLGKENKYYVQYVRYEDMVKAVNGMPTVEAIPKDQYEARLKADLKAILVELQLEIEEIEKPLCHSATYAKGCVDKGKIEGLIQQKINSLKENEDGKDSR